MPFADVDGIRTRYEVLGDGPPLLMFAPGGFNATIENWRRFSIYARLGLLEHLSRTFSCIAFDKRESGESGGRVERLTWDAYAAQGLGLLDHLGIDRAHLIGGCIGCSIAATLVSTHPDRVERVVLYSPAGGPHYRETQLGRFAAHADFARANGLAAVVELARSEDKTFAQEPRLGPWASVIRTDEQFAAEYAARDVDEYLALVDETARSLFDTAAVPGGPFGAEAPALVVPGGDANHTPEAARALAESLPRSDYWDVPVDEQTEATAPERVRDFLQSSDSPRSSAAI
jgi:pimeloyl-ACP methyl ester carboxylesterase